MRFFHRHPNPGLRLPKQHQEGCIKYKRGDNLSRLLGDSGKLLGPRGPMTPLGYVQRSYVDSGPFFVTAVTLRELL